MQIRTLFFLCMGALAAMAASPACWSLTQAVMQYRLAGRIEQAVDVSALLLAAADRLAVERPVVGNTMLADGPADTASLAAIAAARQDADRAFVRVEQRLATLSYQGAPEQQAIIRQVRATLAALRHEADTLLARPKSDREPDFFVRFFARFNALFGPLDAALDLRDLAASQQDGVTMDLIELARQVWTVRGMIGARTAPVMAAIDAAAPLTAPQLEAQALLDGRITAGRTAIEVLLRRVGSMPGLATGADTVVNAFAIQDRLHHDVIVAGRDTGRYPITALALGETAVQTGLKILELRDAALATARLRASETRQTAVVRVATAGTLVALILAGTLAILILLRRRLLAPVLALTAVIGQLARREFDVTIPPPTHDEIGCMAGALEALRRGAIAAVAAEAQILHMSRHDALTGLANRRLMEERLEQAVLLAGRGQKCAVLCLDLDRFKAVNDTFGHPVGDRLLQAVAVRLRACVRESDTVSRFGGDEFVVLLAALDLPASAAVVARRIVKTLSEPFDLDGQILSIGASVGIAVAPQDAGTVEAMLKNADIALYQTKRCDKGSFRFFTPEIETLPARRPMPESTPMQTASQLARG